MSYPHEFVTAGSGDYINDTAGEALGEHKLVYRGTLGTWLLADADALTTMPPLGITLEAIPMGNKGRILMNGYVADTSWSWTVGGSAGKIYASETAGELTQTAPSTEGNVVQCVAIAFFTTGIWFGASGFGGSGGGTVTGTGSIASGTTADIITHGLGYTPLAGDITITLTENPDNTPGAIWVDTIGATTFTVNCENNPGASNLDFAWSARRR